MAEELAPKPSVCPRCKAPFICRADDIQQCQCWGMNLSPEDRANIRRAGFSGEQASCLCRKCLLELKGL